MNKQRLVGGFVLSTVTLLGLLISDSIFADAGGRRAAAGGSIGRVHTDKCGASERPDR